MEDILLKLSRQIAIERAVFMGLGSMVGVFVAEFILYSIRKLRKSKGE